MVEWEGAERATEVEKRAERTRGRGKRIAITMENMIMLVSWAHPSGGVSIASSPCPTDGYILSEHRSVSKGMTCVPPPPPALFVSLLITNQSTYQTDPQSSIRLSPYKPVNKDASLV